MSERTIELEHQTVSLSVAGSGQPVILLHGLTATRHYVVMGSRWLEQNDHCVVSYDARGHGQSLPADSSDAYEYSDLVADLSGIMDALQIPSAILAGASMGAHTALAFALKRPERVQKLVVVTPAFDPTQSESASDAAEWMALASGLREGGVEGFMDAYIPRTSERFTDVVLKATRQRLERHRFPNAVADALETVPSSKPFSSWDELDQLDCPVTVVGSRDDSDPTHPFKIAEKYHCCLPGSKLFIEEVGESPLAWRGAELSRIIAD